MFFLGECGRYRLGHSDLALAIFVCIVVLRDQPAAPENTVDQIIFHVKARAELLNSLTSIADLLKSFFANNTIET